MCFPSWFNFVIVATLVRYDSITHLVTKTKSDRLLSRERMINFLYFFKRKKLDRLTSKNRSQNEFDIEDWIENYIVNKIFKNYIKIGILNACTWFCNILFTSFYSLFLLQKTIFVVYVILSVKHMSASFLLYRSVFLNNF